MKFNYIVAGWLASFASASASASPYELPYAGRVTAADGSPVEGPVTLRVTLSHVPTAGATVTLPPIDLPNVALVDGLFQANVPMTGTDFEALFDGDGRAFIQVKDVTHDVTYPKQELLGVPYARKIAPQTQLNLEADNGSLVGIKPAAGSSAVTYELPPSPEAGKLLTTDGSGRLSWTPGLDQTLTAPLGLRPYATDPAGFTPADEGKVWYDSTTHSMKYWNGTTALALGISGGGLTQLNGQPDSSQGFAVPGTSGTAPNWVSAAGVHTLNLPMASTAGVTAGLLSKAEYDALGAKVGTIASGYVPMSDGVNLVQGPVFVDGSNNVGIGTSSPQSVLHLASDGATHFYVDRADNLAAGPTIALRKARGSLASPSPPLLNDYLGNVTGRGFDGAAYTTAAAAIRFRAAENWTPSAQGSYISIETTPNGSPASSITTAMTIANDGRVGIGSPTPGANLDVAGTIRGTDYLLPGGASRSLAIGSQAAAGSDLTVQAGGTSGANLNGGNLVLSSGTANGTGSSKIELKTASGGAAVTSMTILGNGNVGIGSATPAGKLEIDAGAANNAQMLLKSTDTSGSLRLDVQNGNGNAGFGVTAAGDAFMVSTTAGKGLRFDTTARAPAVQILNSGFVGIGTDTPVSPLNVTATAPNVANAAITEISGSMTSTTNSQQGVRVVPGVTPGAASTMFYYGVTGGPASSSANVSGALLAGVAGSPFFSGTGTLGRMDGLRATPANASTGTVTTSYGLFAQPSNAGTIGTHYGAYFAAPTGAGSVTTKYALVTEAGAGSVGIGTTAPTSTLEIAGDIPQILKVKTGTADHGYMEFFTDAADQNARTAYLGYPSIGSEVFAINNLYAAGKIGLYTGGAPRLMVTNAGDVGIGTTSPMAKLDVNGDVSMASGSSIRRSGKTPNMADATFTDIAYFNVPLVSTTQSAAATVIVDYSAHVYRATSLRGATTISGRAVLSISRYSESGSTDTTVKILKQPGEVNQNPASNDVQFMAQVMDANTGPQIVVLRGKISSTSTFSVLRYISYDIKLLGQAGQGQTITFGTTPGGSDAANNATTSNVLNLTSTGDVGIGTTAPAARLHVAGTDLSGLIVEGESSKRFTIIGGTDSHPTLGPGYFGSRLIGAQNNPVYLEVPGATGGFSVLTDTNGDGAAETFALTVDSTGGVDVPVKLTATNVGIGTPTPAYRFDATDNVSGAGGYVGRFYNTGNSTSSHGLVVQAGSNSAGGATMIYFGRPDGTAVGSIAMNSATTVQYNTTSDRRLKENVLDSLLGLDALRQIKVRDYNYILDPEKHAMQGFIAQELYGIYPQAVTVGGEDATKEPWQIDYGKLTPLLVKSVQDLDRENQGLKDQVKALQAVVCLDHPEAAFCQE